MIWVSLLRILAKMIELKIEPKIIDETNGETLLS